MNVLYLHTHDSGRVLSPYGVKAPTPNLEAFSKTALTFHNCFCVGPTCSPSRAALLTGQYPHQNGMLGLPKPDHLEGVSFAPCLEDPTAAVREAVFAQVNFHTSYEPIRCVRTDRYKYIRYFDDDHLTTNPSNTDESPTKDFFRHNGFQSVSKPREGLYDLLYDMGERNNLISSPEYANIAEELRHRLHAEMERTRDPLLLGPIPIDPRWKVNKPGCQIASSKNPDDYISLGE